jgi:iron-sulfur cluster repair protein YtfE (RIC family)
VQTHVGGPDHTREGQRNALRRFHAEHLELRRSLEELLALMHAIAEGVDNDACARAEARWLFAELEERLPRHFADEERLGFLSDAIELEPRLSQRAGDLRAEHGALRAQLDALAFCVRDAAADPTHWAELECACDAFAEQLAEHEEHEDELILAALIEDRGAAG